MTIGDELEERSRRGIERGADEVWTSSPVQAALRRKKIPLWVMPVLVVVPVWAVIYLGGLSESASGTPTQLERGAEIFATTCAGCHGPSGGGASGPPMTDSAVVATFPDLLGHLQFVWTGTDGVGPAGTPYGDPARAGGPRTAFGYSDNRMPAFGGRLTQSDLLAVVRYEREVLAGATVDPGQLDAAGNLLWPNGEPVLDASGALVTPDGQPLLDADGRLTIEPNWDDPVAGSG